LIFQIKICHPNVKLLRFKSYVDRLQSPLNVKDMYQYYKLPKIHTEFDEIQASTS